MYVCICNAITAKEIRQAVDDGITNLWDLQNSLGVAAGCGSCKDVAMSVLSESLADAKPSGPKLYRPAAVAT